MTPVHFSIYLKKNPTPAIIKQLAEIKLYHICKIALLYQPSYPNKKGVFNFEVLTHL